MSVSTLRLDAETELALARRWATSRDPEARDRLLLSHQHVVRQHARRYQCSGCPFADLVQEGNLGLLRALERYDVERGVRLATYAAWWIRAYILRFVERNSRIVRGTTTPDRTRLFYQLGKTKERLAAAGEDATPQSVARALDVDEQDVVAMELLQSRVASLDAPAFELDGARRIERIAADVETPEQSFGAAEFRERFGEALDRFAGTLHGRRLELFRDRIRADSPASLQELSARWGITQEAARRIERRVSTPLKRYLYREMGDTIVATLGAA
jgi:RNA polymerase sigma-32 factor